MSCVLLAGLALFAPQGTSSFPDTPDNHWAYQAIADLHSFGLSTSFPDSLGTGVRGKTTYVFAVETHAAMSRLHEMSRTSSLKLKPNIELIGAELVKLTTAFSPQLKTLGADPDAMTAQIHADSAVIAQVQLFPDVPQNHWAAEAVADLHGAGILHGYPDGMYHG